MNISFPLRLGWRFFRIGSGNRLISFVSLLAVVGLVAGVALMILVMSVMNGFDREMRTRILSLVPHIQLYREGGIHNWPDLRKELLTHQTVDSVLPFIRQRGMLNFRGNITAVELLGLDPTLQGPYEALGELATTRAGILNGEKSLLVSEKIARKLQASVGDQVVLLAPRGNAAGATELPEMTFFTIVEIFNSHTILDNSLAITDLKTAAQISGLAGQENARFDSGIVSIQGLQLSISDIFNTRNVGYQLLQGLPAGFGFLDWIQSHGNLYQAIQMSRKLVGLLVFAVIAIAVFNVIAMLVMTVMEKRPAIAILKTQGASRNAILLVFLVQGSLIGIFGVALGCVGGIVASLCVEDLIAFIQQWAGFQLLNLEVYPIDYIPADLRGQDVVVIALIALMLNFLATLYPAWKASAVLPAQVLRYE